MTDRNLILAGNLVLIIGLGVLVGLGKISWENFLAGLTLLAFPSAVAVPASKP